MAESLFSKAADLIENAGRLAYGEFFEGQEPESNTPPPGTCFCVVGALAHVIDPEDNTAGVNRLSERDQHAVLAVINGIDDKIADDDLGDIDDVVAAAGIDTWPGAFYYEIPDWNDERDSSAGRGPDGAIPYRRTAAEAIAVLRKTHERFGHLAPR
jgi:hypothetical protein